jgi:hypothetical protein
VGANLALMPRPRKGPAEKLQVIAVYFEPAVRKRLEEIAPKERRSVSNLVAVLVDEALKGRKAK